MTVTPDCTVADEPAERALQTDAYAGPEALLDLGIEDPSNLINGDLSMTLATRTRNAVTQAQGDPALPASLQASSAVAEALNALLADMFSLYLKTKNFHWHVSGPHFRDYHLLFDEQATQIVATTDAIAERVRKIHKGTLHSIGHVARLQRLKDNDEAMVAPRAMLLELMADNRALAAWLHEAHRICDEVDDVASASLIEVWIDEAERRAWFLHEASGAA